MPCRFRLSGLASERWTVGRVSFAAWLATGSVHHTRSSTALAAHHHDRLNGRSGFSSLVSIPPRTHAAVVLDDHERSATSWRSSQPTHTRPAAWRWPAATSRGWGRSRGHRHRPLARSANLVGGRRGGGRVPPALAARVRRFGQRQRRRRIATTPRFGRVVARRIEDWPVAAEDHVAVLRLWLTSSRLVPCANRRVVCRVHSTLFLPAEMPLPEATPLRSSGRLLASINPTAKIARQRKALAREMWSSCVAAIAKTRRARTTHPHRLSRAGSRVTDVHGVGPIMAAYCR